MIEMKKAYRNVERTKRSIQSAFFELLEERKSLDYVTVTDLVNKAKPLCRGFHFIQIYLL